MLDFDYSDGEFLEQNLKELDSRLKAGESPFFSPETYNRLIQHFIQTKNLSKALRVAKMGVEQNPFSLELKIQKAQTYALLGKTDKALGIISDIENLYPNDADLLQMKGELLISSGQFESGIECLNKMLPFSDNVSEIQFQIGMAYEYLEQHKNAISHFRLALEENPAHEEAITELIHCAEVSNKMPACVRYFQRRIDKDPYDSYAWYYLGLAHVQQNDFEQAADNFEYATAINDDFDKAQLNLAHTYMNLGEFEKAFEAYLTTLDLVGENANLFCHIGASKEKQADFGTALKYYKKASELDEQSDEAYFGMAVCLYEKEKWLESVHFYKKATQIASYVQHYWIGLAESEHQLGNWQATKDAFEKAASILNFTPEIWVKWANAFHKEGDLKNAIEIIKEGLEEIPDNAELNYRMCAYNLLAGDYKTALEYLDISLAINYEMHIMLYDFFPTLEIQKVLTRMINQFKEK